MPDPYRSYTSAEKRRRRQLLWSGGRQAIADADTSRQDAEWARIDAKAEERGALEKAEMAVELHAAKRAAAAAKAKERLATREERPAAKQAAREAQREAERVQHKARKYGL